jgi:hypothetical protein
MVKVEGYCERKKNKQIVPWLAGYYIIKIEELVLIKQKLAFI